MWKLERPANRVEFLNESHANLYLEHLLRLEPEARAQRFHARLPEAFAGLHVRAVLSDPRAVIVGYFVDNVLRGAGELLPLARDVARWNGETRPRGLRQLGPAGRTRVAEFALGVERGFRERGIGREIMGAMIREARFLGVRRIEVTCLRDNVAMQRLAARFSAELTRENGNVLGVIERHKDLLDAA